MKQKIKAVVFTQEEHFFIPKNIILASEICDILEVVDNQSKNSAENKISDMVKWFGFCQCSKMGFKTIGRMALNVFDNIFGQKILNGEGSIKSAAKKIGAKYKVIKNINDKDFVEHIGKLNPDIIISYSAPQVVREPLLSMPKYGIINVHGALLPEYRGLLPSFWYLFNDEKTGGATVHFMSSNIDDGSIVIQDSVDISDCKTMFELMKRTKKLGGELIVKAVSLISEGKAQVKPNNSDEGSYYSWPTVEQAKEFRKKGKKLI